MIAGLKVKKLLVHPDVPDTVQSGVRRGFLMEVLRSDEGMLKKFGQSIMTVAYPGTIKGFHVHQKQDDLWFAATGKILAVFYDLRPESPTFKNTETFYAGEGDYKLILIPPGVAHGYKVLSEEPVILFYHATEPYNAQNPDEKRLPYNDPVIGFDWNRV